MPGPVNSVTSPHSLLEVWTIISPILRWRNRGSEIAGGETGTLKSMPLNTSPYELKEPMNALCYLLFSC